MVVTFSRFTVLLLLMLIFRIAQGGEEEVNGIPRDGSAISGGGSAIACFTNSKFADKVRTGDGAVPDEFLPEIVSLKTYDLFEMEAPVGYNPVLPKIVEIGKSELPLEYVDRILRRWNFIYPSLAKSLIKAQARFADDRILFRPQALKYSHDEGSFFNFRSGPCTLVPLAVQETKDELLYLYIDSRLFFHPKLSALSQATLLLHEIAYSIARGKGVKESATTRKLLRFILVNDESRDLLSFLRDVCVLGFHESIERSVCQDGDNLIDLATETFPVWVLWKALRDSRSANVQSWRQPCTKEFQISIEESFRNALEKYLSEAPMKSSEKDQVRRAGALLLGRVFTLAESQKNVKWVHSNVEPSFDELNLGNLVRQNKENVELWIKKLASIYLDQSGYFILGKKVPKI